MFVRIIVTGSLAYDYIMEFPGRFSDHILPERMHMLTVSFLVDSLKRMRGGTAGNVAYTLGLLGAKTALVAAVGQDFADYKTALANAGIDVQGITEVPGELTSSCFITTDAVNNQIVSFYSGAVLHVREVKLASVGVTREDWVVISPTDPQAMLRYVGECRKEGIRYIFDPGKQTPRLERQQVLDGIAGCAALVGNDYEFGMMARMTGLSEIELIALAPFAAVTHGCEGSHLYFRGAAPIHIPVAQAHAVVDVTGAGDAYLAGLVYGLAKGFPHGVTGRLAALTATYAIEKRGCQEHRFDGSAFAIRYKESFGTDFSI